MNAGSRKLAWRASIDVVELPPVKRLGKMVEKFGEIGRVEFLEGRELPQHRPELRPQLGEAGVEKALDEVAGVGEHLCLRDKPRAFDGEDEIFRCRLRPFAKARPGFAAGNGWR